MRINDRTYLMTLMEGMVEFLNGWMKEGGGRGPDYVQYNIYKSARATPFGARHALIPISNRYVRRTCGVGTEELTCAAGLLLIADAC